MKKIPMLFAMNWYDGKSTVDFTTFNDKAKERLEGKDAVATRKIDGTAMMLDDKGNWWARRIVKPGKKIPAGFLEVAFDENTGKHVGWIPAEDSPFAKFWRKALANAEGDFAPGTFELIGPRINSNAENTNRDMLVAHGTTEVEDFPTVNEIFASDDPRALLEPIFTGFRDMGVEGVVWWVDGEPVVKLRAKDFFPEMDSRN